ncbi:redoxin domain-containing protein [Pedobacter alpinus]|uniref:Redoxin domain-containing protein n=1 Tax=Pedobacter alpinus TaxID=1590643 RepID=A0ABW5TT55_9SPHI
MRKQFFLALFGLVLIFNNCTNKKEFIINGKLSNIGDAKKVYLLVLDNLGQMKPVDSTFLDENHEFTLKAKSENPEFYQVAIGQRGYFVIGEIGDEIELIADLSSAASVYQLEGSEEAEKITEYNKITSYYSQKNGELAEKYSKLIASAPGKKDALIAAYTEKSEEIAEPFLKKSFEFIDKNSKSLTAFFAANIITGVKHDAYENKLIAYSKQAKENFPNNQSIQTFAKQMEMAEKVAVGQIAPEITAQGTDGKIIKLSDFKGKYVLIDFWASWCAPCRQENPNLVASFNKFKSKNFTVLGFSLDEDKAAWEKAIKSDKLDWAQVSELKQWDSPTALLYNVSAIPSSFLIDPSGNIIAKNLRGEKLNDFLNKTL